MNAGDQKKISKSMSYVLRHRPDSIGIELEDGGWVPVETLLEAFARSGTLYTRSLIEQVVAGSNKQRFEFSDDGLNIRARQGHSVKVDLGGLFQNVGDR